LGHDAISLNEAVAPPAVERSQPTRPDTTEEDRLGKNVRGSHEPPSLLAEPAALTVDRTEHPSPSGKSEADKPTADADQYLWDVYRRSPTKQDSHGDFSWKDVVAAERLSLSLRDYVIGGMDPDFREQLYQAGRAMDAAGIPWTILSGFRDDFRQSIAAGLKAHPGRSFHGGSVSTGGYGHGCAADLAGVDQTSNGLVWHWLTLHGMEFGLQQTLPRIDPAHIQPRGAWHAIGAALRLARVQREGRNASEVAEVVLPLPIGPIDASSVTEVACTHARLVLNKMREGAKQVIPSGKPYRFFVRTPKAWELSVYKRNRKPGFLTGKTNFPRPKTAASAVSVRSPNVRVRHVVGRPSLRVPARD
jgi:hypothetical protein